MIKALVIIVSFITGQMIGLALFSRYLDHDDEEPLI